MYSNQQVVLPDTLVAQLVDDAATLSEHLHQDFASIVEQRETLRSTLKDQHKIIKLQLQGYQPLEETYTIDGAHLAEVDRASAYSASCAVCVGQRSQSNTYSSCLSVLPHVSCLSSLSSGLMMMQEIMMAVSVVEENPNAFCFIDGSRISAIISINQFYAGINQSLPNQLQNWRQQVEKRPSYEPGRTLIRFESRDWLTPYLTNYRIIGHPKLVTTTTLIQRYAPQWIGRFDDKTFAALILNEGEILEPVPIERPPSPYHINESYPFTKAIDSISEQLVEPDSTNRLYHIYYRPYPTHGIFKIELNEELLHQQDLVGSLLVWWNQEIASPDLQEPYSFYIADRFAKEGVSVTKNALKEIVRRDINTSWAWFLTQSYRT